MSVAPVRKEIVVEASQARAFRVFTEEHGAWWPLASHHIGEKAAETAIIEPRAGGRWFEQDAEGNETDWGHVLAWEPPGLVLLAWQLNASFDYDPELVTEVEITFTPVDDSTRVMLTHGKLERFGDAADRVAAQLSGGWPTIMQRFADYSEEQAK
jgi:Activator of Hsp90 ATPase homolog 1-like protein